MPSFTFSPRLAALVSVFLSLLLSFPMTVSSTSTPNKPSVTKSPPGMGSRPVPSGLVPVPRCAGAHVTDAETPHADCLAAMNSIGNDHTDVWGDFALQKIYRQPRCALRVRISAPPLGGVDAPPLANEEIRNFLKRMAEQLSTTCIQTNRRTRGVISDTFQPTQTWPYALRTEIELRIYGDLNSPLARALTWTNGVEDQTPAAKNLREDLYYMERDNVTYP